MRIHVADYEPGERLALEAPLAPNLNHEGFAFGGAIECIGTLACWGLVWLTLEEPAALIVIQSSEVDFNTPIEDALRAEVQAPDASIWQHFTELFAKHGRARIDLEAKIGDATHAEAACFCGRFVAKRQTSRAN